MVRLIITAFLSLCLLLAVANAEDKFSYLASLLQQKSLLQKNIDEILRINTNVDLNLKISSSQPYQHKVLTSAIRDQSQLILHALSQTFISINQKIGNCSNGNSNNQIISKITNIQTQLQKVQHIVNNQMSCERNDQIKRNYLFYKTITDGLLRQTGDKCQIIPKVSANTNIPFLNINNTKFIPNTQTNQPWIYGQITPQQFTNKKSQLITLYGAAACPQKTPFLDDDNTCKACQNNTVYDISFKKCIVCTNGTSYDKNLHLCTKNLPLNSNVAKNLNFIGKTPTLDATLNLCPQEKPFFDGKTCISCSLPSYFSFISNSCSTCVKGSVFDIKSQSCIINSFFLSNLSDKEKYIGSPLSPLPNENVKICPSDHPFSNGKQCFSCGEQQFFNFQKMKCQSCPQSYNFDPKTHSCVSPNTIFFNSNFIGNRNFNGKVPLYNNLFKSCEQNKPFFNGSQCTQCSLPSYFDFDSLSCKSCGSGLNFNIVIQTCEYIKQDFFTNLQAKGIYYNGNFEDIKALINDKKTNDQGIQMCPDNTPYYNSRSNSCIQCSSSQPLFDFKNNKCMNCPSGSEFEEQSHICLTRSLSATIQRMIMNTS